MRFTMHFKSKTYPLSEELTNKSRQVGSYTHPLFGMLLGSLAAFPCMTACPVLVPILPFAGAILIVLYRKRKFAQFDAEYEKILAARQNKAG